MAVSVGLETVWLARERGDPLLCPQLWSRSGWSGKEGVHCCVLSCGDGLAGPGKRGSMAVSSAVESVWLVRERGGPWLCLQLWRCLAGPGKIGPLLCPQLWRRSGWPGEEGVHGCVLSCGDGLAGPGKRGSMAVSSAVESVWLARGRGGPLLCPQLWSRSGWPGKEGVHGCVLSCGDGLAGPGKIGPLLCPQLWRWSGWSGEERVSCCDLSCD